MLCRYRQENKCKVTNNICPWVIWCSKVQAWKEREGMDKYCRYKQEEDTPKGYSKVEFERHGYLYVTIDGNAIKIENTTGTMPKFVKLDKQLNIKDWRI